MPIVMRETMGRELAVKTHHDVHLEMAIGSVIVCVFDVLLPTRYSIPISSHRNNPWILASIVPVHV